MSIPVTCPECQSHFHVGDEFAGQPGRCPECAAILQVPNPAATSTDPLDPHPYWTPHEADVFESQSAAARPQRRDDRPEGRQGPTDYTDRPRARNFDPHARAARWARVHRGLGYVQGAVVLGFLSLILQTVLFVARGGVEQDPNARADSGQVAMGFGAVIMMLMSWLFWVMGRAGGIRVPYLPARSWARASFIMVLGSIGGLIMSFCCFFSLIGAAAQNGANGGPPGPDTLPMLFATLAVLCLTVGSVAGAEISALVALGRIGDALRDHAAAGWARRSIVLIFIAIGLMMFGLCGVAIYAGERQKLKQQAQAPGPAPAAVDKEKGKENDKAAKGPAEKAKDAAPVLQQGPAGAGQNPADNPIDGPLELVLDLVFFVPLLLYLIHFSVALQKGRWAIRREIARLTGDPNAHDHSHDPHY